MTLRCNHSLRSLRGCQSWQEYNLPRKFKTKVMFLPGSKCFGHDQDFKGYVSTVHCRLIRSGLLAG